MIWALLGSKPLRLAVGVLVAMLGYEGWKYHEQNVGATKVVEKAKQAGRAANDKNEIVRRRAAEPGAADRLRKEFCRDCSK